MLKVWDLRQFQSGVPVATFKHHNAPVTSVEWHPTDSTVFAASGDDNQVTIWDLAVEKDEEDEEKLSSANDLPPQLLFIHMVCIICLRLARLKPSLSIILLSFLRDKIPFLLTILSKFPARSCDF